MTEHTKDKLAAALREVGLDDMANKAATGYYHDFLSPLDLPEVTLMQHLREAASGDGVRRAAILALRGRVMDGDFDATAAESEEWAQSPEGLEAFRRLLGPS
ncbi:hypothetical protein [Bradyrhizobium sp. SEMIA]|uniref:hypothetical protein n=1 Tax=Bradyrhizobium sp. SEMIA TaxID=2597515 RepID=UPI0018A40EE7|nr:hypothetical protein [Bradyrhizobium sp. SEMIA]QOG23178.1 hypothetical protein FOM02_43945 [Bradyrhizobium sp. SEMIA]